jgi:hypothetical protein
VVDAEVQAWRVHDTGLVAVPSRFRRLGGLVRHLQGHGDAWPDAVTLTVDEGALRVTGPDGAAVGIWPLAEVRVTPVAAGPPRSFVLEVPDAAQLLAAAAAPATDAVLAALGASATGPPAL